jgi:TPR repeat protein
MFFGRKWVAQNISLALERAAKCEHPEARWLASVFAGKSVASSADARDVLLALEEEDKFARGVCFACCLEEPLDMEKIRPSSDLGYGLAQATLGWQSCSAEESFSLAQRAAAQQERDGFRLLAYCYRHGFGVRGNNEEAKRYYLLAAELVIVFFFFFVFFVCFKAGDKKKKKRGMSRQCHLLEACALNRIHAGTFGGAR